MRKTFLFVSFVVVAMLVSCNGKSPATGEKHVMIDTVKVCTQGEVLEFPGRVKVAQEMDLSFRVSGQIEKLTVDAGQAVKKGQLLALLDSADYRIQLDATEAEYRQVKAEAERVMALYKEDATTPAANDKAVYGLQQITAKYNNHKDQLSYTRLYAPVDGSIQKRLFEEHETVGAGMPVLQMVSSAMPEVEINIPVTDYVKRESFTGYSCSFTTFGNESYTLLPVSILPKANANQLYTVKLRFADVEGKPKPQAGMTANVTIFCTPNTPQRFEVPAGALFNCNGNSYIYVYDAAGQTVNRCMVAIESLNSNGGAVVTSDCLKAGLTIVASGARHLTDGEKVIPLPTVSKTNVGGLL